VKSLFRRLPFRLNAGLITIYFLSSLTVFYFFDHLLHHYLNKRLDEYLETEILSLTSEVNLESLPEQLEEVRRAFVRFGHAHGTLGAFVALWDEQNRCLASSDLAAFQGPERSFVLPADRAEVSRTFNWQTVSLGGQSFRIIQYVTPDRYQLLVGFSMEETQALYHILKKQFGLALFFILTSGGVLGWWFSVHTLKGLSYLNQRTQMVRKKGDLHHRIHVPTGSVETDELGESINGLLERIEDLVRNLNYVMDNIAHDIRTPVTRMRGHAEMQLGDTQLTPREMEMAGQMIEECDQILNLVNILLEITAADSGLFQPTLDYHDAAAIIGEGCELFEPVAEAQQLTLVQVLPPQLSWRGDARVLQRVLSNLLDNAIKYSPKGQSVRVVLQPQSQGFELVVSDSGSGIEAGEEALIFQRFFRGTKARSQQGNGLGLSFCQSIVEAIGGQIRFSPTPGGGATFSVLFPDTPAPGTGLRE
jgi:signal transduction histidine kinase